MVCELRHATGGGLLTKVSEPLSMSLFGIKIRRRVLK